MTNARNVAYARCPAYKISKAALNALTVQYALSYEGEGFTILAVNPGVSLFYFWILGGDNMLNSITCSGFGQKWVVNKLILLCPKVQVLF